MRTAIKQYISPDFRLLNYALWGAFENKTNVMIKVLVFLILLLRRNGMNHLKNLFWRHANRFEWVLIKQLKKMVAILSKFTVFVPIFFFFFFFFVYIFKSKLILFYHRVVCYYTRIFLIFPPHSLVVFLSFPKVIIMKLNIIGKLEFKLTYCDVTIQHVSHYAAGAPPIQAKLNIFIPMFYIYFSLFSRSVPPISRALV